LIAVPIVVEEIAASAIAISEPVEQLVDVQKVASDVVEQLVSQVERSQPEMVLPKVSEDTPVVSASIVEEEVNLNI
jgi:hypothetical protein